MFKNILLAGALTLGFAAPASANDTLNAATDTVTKAANTLVAAASNLKNSLALDTKTLEYEGVRYGNPIDTATWWDGTEKHAEGHAPELNVNFADPDFWTAIINPKQHGNIHHAMTNPATWAQFIKPTTYLKMMDINVWTKWVDAKSYDVVLDPQTYAYWMQPGAYLHTMDMSHYAQLLNADAYKKLADESAKAVSETELNEAATMLNPFSWLSSNTKKAEEVKTEG